jgi:hypothetical protein
VRQGVRLEGSRPVNPPVAMKNGHHEKPHATDVPYPVYPLPSLATFMCPVSHTGRLLKKLHRQVSCSILALSSGCKGGEDASY